jgi:hypothetical protein
MEYLEENLEEWLGQELDGYGDDDYLVFDCPGQVSQQGFKMVRCLGFRVKNVNCERAVGCLATCQQFST